MLRTETPLEKLTNENLAIAAHVTKVVIETTANIEATTKAFQEKNREILEQLQEQLDKEAKDLKPEDQGQVLKKLQDAAAEEQKKADEKRQQELEKQRAELQATLSVALKHLDETKTTLAEKKIEVMLASNRVIAATENRNTANETFQNARVTIKQAGQNYREAKADYQQQVSLVKQAEEAFNTAANTSNLSPAELKANYAQLAIAERTGATEEVARLNATILNSFENAESEANCRAAYNHLATTEQRRNAAEANFTDATQILNKAKDEHRESRSKFADAKAEISSRNKELQSTQSEQATAAKLAKRAQETVNEVYRNLNQFNPILGPQATPSPKPTAAKSADILATSIDGRASYSLDVTKKGLTFQPSSLVTHPKASNQVRVYKDIEKVENALFKQFLANKGFTLDTEGIKKNGALIYDITLQQIQNGYAEFRNADNLNTMADKMKDDLGGRMLKFSQAPKPSTQPVEEKQQQQAAAYATSDTVTSTPGMRRQ